MIDKKTPIEELKEFTQEKKYKEIKQILTSLDKTIKGQVFEEYLQYLYDGNGFRVKLNGGRGDLGADLLLYDQVDIQKLIWIVQVKNQKKVLTFKDTLSEIMSFERKAQEKLGCDKFRIVSISGFVENSNELTRFNLQLRDWRHVEELIKTYSTDIHKKPKLELFPHNELAFDEIIKLFQKNNRVAVVQATGTGKSHIIAQLILEYGSKKILFLSPSKLIFNQFQESFDYPSQGIDFVTYQQLMTDFKSGEPLKSYEFIILDEFHRIGAEKWGKSVDALLSKNENSKVLGTTATPIRYLDGRRDMAYEKFQARTEDLSLADAIERKILPRPLYISSFYSVAEEIKTLEDEISNSNISKDESDQYKEELKNIAIDWEESRGVPELLKKHLKPSMRKFVVFCRDKKHLNDMSDVVSTWFRKSNPKLKREKYQITSGDLQNKKTLQKFKKAEGTENTIHLLFCIDMLNEGLHIEGVHGVILLRTTESPIIFYQQIGRCLKVQSGSDNQPIIFDLVNNFKSIKSNDFKTDLDNAKIKENKIRAKLGLPSNMSQVEIIDNTTWFDEILSRIREQIENWEVRFAQLVAYNEEFGDCDVPTYYLQNKVLGTWVSSQRTNKKKGKLGSEKFKKLEELGFKWSVGGQDEWDTAWWKRFNELVAYKDEFGNCDVPNEYSQNKALGLWVSNQRANNKKGKLCLERKEKLTEIGFNWSVGGQDELDIAWGERFNELVAYKKEFGNCDVPQDYPPNKVLGAWVSTQRANNKKGKLDSEQFKKLEELGFKWDLLEAAWETSFNELMAYKKEFGNCDVPTDYLQNKVLGTWVSSQRTNKKKGKLGSEKFKKLEELGFKWSVGGQDEWDTAWWERFNELVAYKKEFGNCDVPTDYLQNKVLGTWVSTQRANKKKGKLGSEKFKNLEEIDFNWDPRDNAWETSFNELRSYKKEVGNCDLPNDYPPNKALGNWVGNQRTNKKKGKLDSEQFKKLEELGFKWDLLEAAWETSFNELMAYKKEFGNCDVPTDYLQNKVLGTWVSSQRTNKKKGKLGSEKFKKLEELGFKWDLSEAAWETSFNELMAYKKEIGDCDVIKDYLPNKALGKWVSKQRGNNKKGKLDQQRVEKLEEIGFKWSVGGQDEWDTAWKKKFNEFLAYKKDFGNCDVPNEYSQNKALGLWLGTQRTNKKKGKLGLEKIEKLKELGFKWDPRDTTWETNFNDLSAYKKEFGNCDVPQDYPPNKVLGAWVSTQRANKKKGKLDQKKVEKLEEIGFKWSVGRQEEWDTAWETRFNELMAYKKEFGDCDVPIDYLQNKALGNWVDKQRADNKKDKLGSEKFKKLEEIGFKWSLRNQEAKEVTEKEIKIITYLKPNKPQIELFPDN